MRPVPRQLLKSGVYTHNTTIVLPPLRFFHLSTIKLKIAKPTQICMRESRNARPWVARYSEDVIGLDGAAKTLGIQVNPYREQLRTQQPNDGRVRPACR